MIEKFCPVCSRKNETDSDFCIFCGASLESTFRKSITTTRQMEKVSTGGTGTFEKTYVESLEIPAKGIALYLMDFPKPIAVCEEQEFVLGRKLTDTLSGKFVDLTPFGGYELGVSHRHAMIRLMADGYEITDLESTNGTQINKNRLFPNKPYPIPSGSQIRLGKLNLYAIYPATNPIKK
jgi:hypothetical protein